MTMEQQPINYSHTKVSTWDECARRFFWLYVMRLKPLMRELHFTEGGAIHDFLANYHQAKDIKVSIDEMVEYFRREWNPSEHDAKTVLEMAEMVEMSKRLMHGYATLYPNTTAEHRTLAVETDFSVPLGDRCHKCGRVYSVISDHKCECGAPVFYWVGRADWITKMGRSIFVWDHKTTKSAGEKWMDNWRQSFQLYGYVYAIQKSMGYTVNQFGVNVIKKLKTFGTDKQKGDPFLRRTFPVIQQNVDRFVLDRLQKILRIEESKRLFDESPDERQDLFPMCETSCGNYGGCKYSHLCWNHKPTKWWEIPEGTLAALFQARDIDASSLVAEEVRSNG